MGRNMKDARAECYHGIRHRFTESLTRYYKKNPAFMDDARGQKETASLLELMHEVLKTLDGFEIMSKGER
jgi:hypothetical protein